MYILQGIRPPLEARAGGAAALRAEAYGLYADGDISGASRALLDDEDPEALGMMERTVRAHLLAEAGSAEAGSWIERVRGAHAADAEVLEALLLWRGGRREEAAALLARAFGTCRRDPWALPHLVERGLDLAVEMAEADAAKARILFDALGDPFAAFVLDEKRLTALVQIGCALGPEALSTAIVPWEPHVPWEDAFLAERADAYRRAGHPLADRAERERAKFTRAARESGS